MHNTRSYDLKLVLTGGSGFVGRHLCEKLIEHDIEFVCIVRPNSDKSFFVERGIRTLDLNYNIETLAKIFIEESFSGIIHLASCFRTEHQAKDIDDLLESNIRLGTYMLELSVISGVKFFINTGTFWQHFQGAEYDPVNLYAATKQAFEDIARYYSNAYGLRFCTIKLCDTYGPGDTRNKIFNLWDKISTSGDTLKMSPGEQLIDIVHVDVVVDAYIKIIKALVDQQSVVQNFESYYVTSGKAVSLKELAKEFERNTKRKLNIEWGAKPYRSREVMHPKCIGIAIEKSDL